MAYPLLSTEDNLPASLNVKAEKSNQQISLTLTPSIILVTLQFNDFLLYGTPVLAVIFAYLLLKSASATGTQSGNRWRIIAYVHCILLFALAAITGYSIYAGSRPFIYFLVVASLFITSVLIALNPNKKNNVKLLFLTAIILAISVPVAVIAGNQLYPYNSFGNESILQTGTILTYQTDASESGLYYYIPVGTLVEASVALVTGQALITPLIFTVMFLVAIVTGVFSLIMRLSHNSLAAIISVFFCLSIPSLSFFGRLWPLVYAVFYLLFAILLYRSSWAAVGLWIVSLPMIFAHPSGFIAIIVVLLPLALLGIKNWPETGQSSNRLRMPLVTLTVIAFAYLTYTYLITLMANQGVKFYSSMLAYFSGASVITNVDVTQYVPRYYSSSFALFAYAWVVPVALSAALLLSVIFYFIRKKKPDSSQSFIIISALTGLLIIFLAYLSSSGETGQYLIPVGYLLVLLPSSVVAAKLLSNRRKYTAIVALFLVAFIFIGTYSPDWAPLEHQDFDATATILPVHSYLEAGTIAPLVSANSTVYYDYDFPLGNGNYKPVRNVIMQISSGIDPMQFAGAYVTLYGVKDERLPESNGLEKLDTVYSSGFHSILIIEASAV